MSNPQPAPEAPPEHNVTGTTFPRDHLPYRGPLIDFHAHVMQTRPNDPPAGPPGDGPGFLDQATTMLDIAAGFGVEQTLTMCQVDDVVPLRARFGNALAYNGSIMKKPDEPDDAAYRLLDRWLALGAKVLKFWSAPRGRERGLIVDAPWRVESARRARAAGVRVIMVHVSDPEVWFKTTYADVSKFGTRESQYVGLVRLLEEFPDIHWVGAHMGGDPEHPDHLRAMLERYPNLSFDTSATKWQVREVSARPAAVRELVCRFPDRFLFGSDLVTRHQLPPEHYVSRYWCQRTLWESTWTGQSPIADPDAPPSPPLRGVGLPADVLRKVYYENAVRLLG